jgi:CRISPR-associated protein (TIGR02584 family)
MTRQACDAAERNPFQATLLARERRDPAARRILLAAAGLSPQVVTETLYALSRRSEAAALPSEVHLVTTEEGAERARLSLLSEEPGWFRRFQREYDMPDIRFDATCIHVLRDSTGSPLRDIRTEDDNLRAADAITALVRGFTSEPDTTLHVSIAGGRKTIGFYLGYALSLFGRPQDRLSHVLVSAPFESHPAFFYPTRKSSIIYTPPPDSRPLDTSQAQVSLAEIPFLRLRNWVPASLLTGAAGYGEVIEGAQRRLGPPRLVLDLAASRIEAAGLVFALPPAEMAFLAWMARRATLRQQPVECPSEGAPEPELARQYLAVYDKIAAERDHGQAERTRQALRRGMEKQFFLERQARLKARLRKALGPYAEPYLVKGHGKRPHMRYGLDLDPRSIEFGPVAPGLPPLPSFSAEEDR